MSAVLFEAAWQTRWGAGPGPVAIDREVVHGMTDWRWFGRAPDFTAKIKDVIAQGRDRRKCVKGSCMGLFAIGFGLCHENWIIPLH